MSKGYEQRIPQKENQIAFEPQKVFSIEGKSECQSSSTFDRPRKGCQRWGSWHVHTLLVESN